VKEMAKLPPGAFPIGAVERLEAATMPQAGAFKGPDLKQLEEMAEAHQVLEQGPATFKGPSKQDLMRMVRELPDQAIFKGPDRADFMRLQRERDQERADNRAAVRHEEYLQSQARINQLKQVYTPGIQQAMAAGFTEQQIQQQVAQSLRASGEGKKATLEAGAIVSSAAREFRENAQLQVDTLNMVRGMAGNVGQMNQLIRQAYMQAAAAYRAVVVQGQTRLPAGDSVPH
jgi:hypothetical protein